MPNVVGWRSENFAMPARIVFTGQRRVSLEGFAVPEVGPDQVCVRSLCSLMSTGTENIVFNRLFDPGTHWDQWVRYPFYPGYSTIAEVEACGAQVTSVKIGDRIACRAPHASHHVLAAERCFPLPTQLDARQAVWFALAKIAFIGARAACYHIGDSVLIIGAGPIGQMSTRWARALGARSIVVVDPVEQRLPLARAGGATATIAQPIAKAEAAVRAACGGVLPRVVIDSTGHAAVFAAALPLVADRGRVVVLGDTGSPASQGLTSDVITRGLTIVGAHDCHVDAQWNDASIAAYTFALAGEGRFPLADLITDVFSPDRCVEAYAAANARRGDTMGICFDWTAALPEMTGEVASAGQALAPPGAH